MSNVVFILGAGASKQCGAPLMANFLDVASDLLRSKLVENKRREFERVFSAIGSLQLVHSKAQLDLNNIESIFTVLELGRVIKRVPGLKLEEVEAAIAALKELIVKTLETTIKFPLTQGYVSEAAPYGDLARLLKHLCNEASPKQTASVISFNYDMAADMAMYRAGLGPDYVIDESDADLNADTVPLLKLHGSLNWATVKSTKEILPYHLRDYFRNNRYEYDTRNAVSIPIGSNLEAYFRELPKPIEVENEPVIVPPSWNKADYHSALSDVWAAAAKHLSEAEHIFIIGYSLPETDSFFRHLYALGSVGSTPLRRIVVFNPDNTDSIKQRFESLLGPGARARYEYHPKTFDEAITHIQWLFRKDGEPPS